MDFAKEYELRKEELLDELRTVYLDIYEDRFDSYTFLLKNLDNAFSFRSDALKALDVERSKDSTWYHKNNSYGMTVCSDNKENNIKNLTEQIPYMKDFDISFVNIMPVLKQSLVVTKQGGLPEFISVDLNHGSIADVHNFCMECHKNGISVCFDNIGEYCKAENIEKIFANPLIFNKLIYDILMFANIGVDIFKINTRPYKWNDLGLDYPYTDQKYHIVRIIRLVLQIVCPGCLLLCNAELENGKSFSFYGSLTSQECHLVNNISNKELLMQAIETKNVNPLRPMIDTLAMISKNTVFLNYIQDPWQSDWKNLGSICGIDKASDRIELEMAIDFDMTLQGYLMMIPGVPLMFLGDEIGQTTGKTIDWSKAKLRFNASTFQYKIYNNLMRLKRIREVYDCFSPDARCFTYDSFDPSVLAICRSIGDKKLIGLFNFSPVQKAGWVIDQGPHTDILTNEYYRDQSILIKPYGMAWLYNQRPETLEDY